MRGSSAQVRALAATLADLLPRRVERAAPSAPVTTYRCGGPIALLVRVDRQDDLVVLADALGTHPEVPVLVIGRGSNLLISDAGFDGVAVVLGGEFERIDVDGDRSHVDAGSAVPLPVLARQAAKAGIAGLEFFAGIPGSVGGGVRMNAGGHGAETKDVIVSARVFSLATAQTTEVDGPGLGFEYRHSALGPRSVVLSASFAGHADDPAACERRIDEIVRWRREHQPGGQNAGSVFTNPPGDTAGRLIDACGCKGMRVGDVVVSEKHANFFAAGPDARADDVVALMELVRTRVESATGVYLVPELQLVGFADRSEETAR